MSYKPIVYGAGADIYRSRHGGGSLALTVVGIIFCGTSIWTIPLDPSPWPLMVVTGVIFFVLAGASSRVHRGEVERQRDVIAAAERYRRRRC